MIRIPGRNRPSNYFPGFSSRLVKYRTALFLGGSVLLLLLLVPGSRSVFAQRSARSDPALLSIAVTPADAEIFPDRRLEFTARGMYSDGRTHDLTKRVMWSSSAPDVVTISREGIARAIASGQTTIEAALGAIKGSATLNVVIGGTFVLTGSLSTARTEQTATLLNNGLVLIAGGVNPNGKSLASAELYNPATGTFSYTAGSLNTERQYYTATLLNNGMVLLAGGRDSNNNTLASAELYNPATGTFSNTGSMNTARNTHTATLLDNGMVLMAGGGASSIWIASAELYNPATGTFTSTGSMNTARIYHTATLLNNGMVLIAGGQPAFAVDQASAELYNPATGTFSYTGSMNSARSAHAATLLNNGMVLLAAGETEPFLGGTSAELYDPATGTFSYTGSLNTPLQWPRGTLLDDGTVLIAGGQIGDFGSVVASAELYNPATGTFSNTGSMSTVRVDFTATRLNNGLALMAGGQTGTTAYLPPSGSILGSAELYEPATRTPPDLESINITPERHILSPGETEHFIAMGRFRDGSTEQLASVTWSSSDPRVAQISNDASNHGVGLAIARGEVIIEARAGRVRGWARLTVR